jgi:hypothetical protein
MAQIILPPATKQRINKFQTQRSRDVGDGITDLPVGYQQYKAFCSHTADNDQQHHADGRFDAETSKQLHDPLTDIRIARITYGNRK